MKIRPRSETRLHATKRIGEGSRRVNFTPEDGTFTFCDKCGLETLDLASTSQNGVAERSDLTIQLQSGS